MSNDTGLLRQYVEERSESAFAELVREHVNLVYAAAWRESQGDTALAEDLAQEVFTELARKAAKLLGHPSLAGWLYTTVRHLAANARRAEARRRRREETVHRMNAIASEGAPEQAWEQIRPVLDDALHEMQEADRTAIVLRFLEDRPLREVGAALGLQENAARMRVDRALEKLRGLLARRGITSTASGLAAALAAGVVLPAPTAFAATVASMALANSAAASVTTLTLLQTMALSKLQVGLVGALIVTGIAVPAWQQARLRTARSTLAQLQADLPELRAEVSRLRQLETDHAELERLRQWQAQTQPELLRLRGMAGVARRANEEAGELRAQLQRLARQGGANPAAGPMGEYMRNALEQEVAGELARMTARLHLTPDQAQAVEAILQRQARLSSAGIQQAFSDKFNQEELAKLGREAGPGRPEEQIKALLRPEQQADYKMFQQEEAARSARQAANMELLQMEGSLGLTPEQEDQVFSALYEVIFQQSTGAGTPALSSSAEQLQWVNEQKAKALEPVLSPTQMVSFRQQQEVQLKFFKEIQGKMQGAESKQSQSTATGY